MLPGRNSEPRWLESAEPISLPASLPRSPSTLWLAHLLHCFILTPFSAFKLARESTTEKPQTLNPSSQMPQFISPRTVCKVSKPPSKK